MSGLPAMKVFGKLGLMQQKANQILKEQMVEYKNPGTGIPYKDSSKVIGKHAKFNIPKDTLLTFEMFI